MAGEIPHNIITSLHGNELGIDETGAIVGPYDWPGVTVGFIGQGYRSNQNRAKRIELFDDFLGDVIEDGWSAAKGTDGAAVIAAAQAGAIGGAVRLTSGATTVVAESISILTHFLNWRASNGSLVFETRITPITTIANVQYFVGFTDVLATTTLEQPFNMTTATLTSTASNAVGFLFDTAATAQFWQAVGVKADVDATTIVSTKAPVADTAQTLRVVVNSAGTATFYIDGVLVGTMANAVTAATALTPVVEIMSRTTAARIIEVDYILAQSDR